MWRAEREAVHAADRGESAELERVIEELELSGYIDRLVAERVAQGGGRSGVAPGEEVARVLRAALAAVIDPPARSSARLEAQVIGLAVGFPGLGSMREVGRAHGLGRAAISRRVLALVDKLGLPPSHYMKAAASRDVYRRTNRRKRAAHEASSTGNEF